MKIYDKNIYVDKKTHCHTMWPTSVFRMDVNCLRLIPNVFRKLLDYIAPADIIVWRNAHHMFGPIGYRAMLYRLVMPKKGMLMLAWPFCMHNREDVSKFYKQVEFYDIIRSNVMSGGASAEVAVATVREFLVGFESLMMWCVLSNTKLFVDLEVLMLNFHPNRIPHDDDGHHNVTHDQLKLFQTESSSSNLHLNSELWGNAINAVVAQCAPTSLRHFLFYGSSWLPDEFFVNLELDCMLAQMQQLQTLYMPSIMQYEEAHSNFAVERPCWQALHELPIGNRLPNLQRFVMHSPTSWAAFAFDVNAVRTAFNINVGSVPISFVCTAKLPRFQCLLPNFAVEAMDPSGKIGYYFDINNDNDNKAVSTKQITEKLTLSHDLHSILDEWSKLRFSMEQITRDRVEHSVRAVAANRLQMLSVLNDVTTNYYDGSSSSIPARLVSTDMLKIDTYVAAVLLNTLSRSLSWPLSLTLELDWNGLLQHVALFQLNKSHANAAAAVPAHWTTCFTRGVLKLKLTINRGFQQFFAETIKYKHLSLDNRYGFPPLLTIEFRPPDLWVKSGANHDDNNIMPSIREHFKKHVQQQFIDDIVGEKPIFADKSARLLASTRTFRGDLYETCRKLIIVIEIRCDTAILQRVKRLLVLHEKQFERELVEMFCKPGATLSCTAADETSEEEPQFIMPNLKSISILRMIKGVTSSRRVSV